MPKSIRLAAFAFVLLAGGCSQAADDASPASAPASAAEPAGPAPAFHSYDGWIGTWTGVEGMVLEVSPAGDGNYIIDMQSDLDTNSIYTGIPTAEGIEFNRGGQKMVLREATGAETGLKWLDGKQDCLMVATGEGFCRD